MLDNSGSGTSSFVDFDLRAYADYRDFLSPLRQRVLHALRVCATDRGEVVGKSWAELAKIAGCDKRTVGRALAALRENLMVHVERAGRNRREKSVIYVAMSWPIDHCRSESALALADRPPRAKRG